MKNNTILVFSFILFGAMFVGGLNFAKAETGTICNGSPNGWDFLAGGLSADVNCNSPRPIDAAGVVHAPQCCAGPVTGGANSSSYVSSNCQDWSYDCPCVPGSASCSKPCSPGGRLVINYGYCLVNGVCGTADGKSVSSAPIIKKELCSKGKASTVSGLGPWAWTCTGSNGGKNASCKAYPTLSCNPAYIASVTEWSSCSGGLSYATQVTYATTTVGNPTCADASTVRSCTPDNSSTCSDGIKNGTETGVDCGGTCPACGVGTPTCSDGIKNGTETGVDCGGVCPACGVGTPTCSDGIKNGTETGVDCGGICPACGAPDGGSSFLPCQVIMNPSYTPNKVNIYTNTTWEATSSLVNLSGRASVWTIVDSNGTTTATSSTNKLINKIFGTEGLKTLSVSLASTTGYEDCNTAVGVHAIATTTVVLGGGSINEQ